MHQRKSVEARLLGARQGNRSMPTITTHIARALMTVVLGATLASQVLVSVFADGSRDERRIVIAAILVGYALAGVLVGYVGSLWHGVGLVPLGLVALVVMGEGASWLWLYGALIVACALGGAYGGATLRADTGSSDTPQ